MPVYTYRRDDGTTFEIRQSYQDNPLTQDPETGQKVVRLIQNAGVIFKGSGFYVNDSKSSSKKSSTASSAKETSGKSDSKSSDTASTDTPASAPAEKSTAVETKPAASTTSSADAAR